MEQSFFKRILALLLCLVMAFSTVSTALAIELPKKDVINYVSLGDSMTNGYGLDGYYATPTITGDGQVNGFRQNDVTESYPALFKEYLKELYPKTPLILSVSFSRPLIQAITAMLPLSANSRLWRKQVQQQVIRTVGSVQELRIMLRRYGADLTTRIRSMLISTPAERYSSVYSMKFIKDLTPRISPRAAERFRNDIAR